MSENPPKPIEYPLEDKDWLEIVDTPEFEYQGNGEELVNPDLRERIKSINDEQAEYEYAVGEEEKIRASHVAEEQEALRLAEVKEHLGIVPPDTHPVILPDPVTDEKIKTDRELKVKKDKRKLELAVRRLERQLRADGSEVIDLQEVREFPDNTIEQANEELAYKESIKESIEKKEGAEDKKDPENKPTTAETTIPKPREEKKKDWKKMSPAEQVKAVLAIGGANALVGTGIAVAGVGLGGLASVGVFNLLGAGPAIAPAIATTGLIAGGATFLGMCAHAFFLEYFAINIITEGYSRLKKWISGGIMGGGGGGHKPAKAAAHKPAGTGNSGGHH